MTITSLPRARAAGALLCAVVAIGAVHAPPASAHTGLTSSDPADGAELSTAPASVTLTFSDPMDAEYSQVAVTDADESSVTEGEPRVDGSLVTQPLAADVPPGRYAVAYRVVSADGHPVSGGLGFRVAGAGAEGSGRSAPADAPTDDPADDPVDEPQPVVARDESSGLGVGMAVVLTALIAVGGVVSYVVRRRGERGDD
ncbi:copper resistance CopC family protein [Streptomyces mayteni]